jgi:leader peptidase (prepilin peptidase) / N-methyltransferase
VHDGTPLATGVAVVTAVLAGPYLAGLTRTAPDRDQPRWWHTRRVAGARVGATISITAILAVLGALATGWTAPLPAFVCLALTCAVLIIVDVERHRLPDRVVVPAAVLGAMLLAAATAVTADGNAFVRAMLAAAAAFSALFIAAVLARGGLGFGDVKVGALLGGHLGWLGWGQLAYGLFAGFVVGAVAALALVATGRASLRTSLPFGPALIAGAFTVAAGSAVF